MCTPLSGFRNGSCGNKVRPATNSPLTQLSSSVERDTYHPQDHPSAVVLASSKNSCCRGISACQRPDKYQKLQTFPERQKAPQKPATRRRHSSRPLHTRLHSTTWGHHRSELLNQQNQRQGHTQKARQTGDKIHLTGQKGWSINRIKATIIGMQCQTQCRDTKVASSSQLYY